MFMLKNEIEQQVAQPGTDIPRRAYSIAETAAILGISETSVRRLIKRNKLRACQLLRHYMIPSVEIDRLLGLTSRGNQ
jgi:excisionase family DNA binding protein